MTINEADILWIRKPIRRLHLRVYTDGRVVVSTPWHCSRNEVEKFVETHREWIIKSRTRLMAQGERPPLPAISQEQKEELTSWLTTRIEYWRVQMSENPVTWKVRNMKSQWGNCRAQSRRLTFNLQLARVPENLRDYIVVHELAHLKVQNHSPKFYERVAIFMPDWSVRRKQLKQYTQ